MTKKHHLTEGDCCLRLGSWDSYEVKMKLPKAHTLGPLLPILEPGDTSGCSFTRLLSAKLYCPLVSGWSGL